MKKYTIFYLIILNVFCLVASNSEKWQEKNASFRAKIKTNANQENSLIFNDWLFPDSLANGIVAFGENGKKLELKQEINNRAVIFPKSNKDEIITLYGGYNSENSFNVPQSQKHNMLKLNIVNVWRLSGNKEQYLEQFKHTIRIREQRDYTNTIKYMQSDVLQSMLTPPVLGEPIPAGWWDINSLYPMQKTHPYLDSIYNCRHILGGAKWRFFNKYNLRVFWADLNRYKYRFFSRPNGLIIRKGRNVTAWKKKRDEDHDKVLFENLKKSYESRKKYNLIVNYPNSFRLFSREQDLHANIVAHYQGKLFIPNDKNYEFEINTNSMWLMEIDSKIVAKKMLNTSLNDKHLYRFKLDLKKGLHDFEFYYARCSSPLNFEIRYREKNHQWKLFDEKMFAPAPTSELLSLELNSGKKFPKIKRNILGIFMIGKQNYLELNQLELPEEAKFIYDNQSLDYTSLVALANDKYAPKQPIKLNYLGNNFDLPTLDKYNKTRQMNGDFSVEIKTPSTIYDDEKVAGSINIRNNYPYDLTLFMTTKIKKQNGNEITKIKQIKVPKGFSTQNFSVIPTTLSVDISLWLPGFKFGEVGVSIIPAKDLTEDIVIIHDNLFENKFLRQICVVLERMNIGKLREWEFLKLLQFKDNPNILVLGDANLLNKKIDAKFTQLKWPEAQVNGESSLLRGIKQITKELKITKANQVIIIPPIADIPLLSEEKFFRYFAIILDKVRAEKNIKKVYIQFPNNKYKNKFYNICREYGFILI